nr:nuclear transport factor 2 family protein [Tahibacter caeni]
MHADASLELAQFSDCFTADAEVRDEGRTIHGVDAIVEWKRASRARYDYRVHPQSVARRGDTVTMQARVSGSFKGSPVDLTYRFELRDDRISKLEIH